MRQLEAVVQAAARKAVIGGRAMIDDLAEECWAVAAVAEVEEEEFESAAPSGG